MKTVIKKYNFTAAILAFIILPTLLWHFGDFPRRTLLKDSISVLTLLAFFMMTAQFFLARSNRVIRGIHKMSRVVTLHKIIGYTFVLVCLLHPFLVVVPRYFESGVEPEDAFMTMLTTFSSPGVVLGMSAWGLLSVLVVTSFFRNRLGMKYPTWRVFHGVLSSVFIMAATWHAVDLGRHTDPVMSGYMILGVFAAVLLLLRTYLFKPVKKTGGIEK